jgi:hypothetical protein
MPRILENVWKYRVSNYGLFLNRTRPAAEVMRYEAFRDFVLWRDSACVVCGDTKRSHLHVHHRVRWIDNEELRYDPENAVSLCKTCHRLVHKGMAFSSFRRRSMFSTRVGKQSGFCCVKCRRGGKGIPLMICRRPDRPQDVRHLKDPSCYWLLCDDCREPNRPRQRVLVALDAPMVVKPRG